MNQKFTSMDDLVFGGLLLIIIFSSITVFLVTQSLQEKNYYSELFLLPNNYSNFVINDETYFSFGITNMEEKNLNYTVRFVAGQKLVSTETFFVEKGKTLELEKKVQINEINEIFPYKFRIILTTPSGTESAFFWLKGKKIS